MKITLSKSVKEALELQHKRERDRRVADRIKSVLLRSEGWSQKQIAQALRIRAETVSAHLEDYIKEQKLKPENGGSSSFLNSFQAKELLDHIESNTYSRVLDICIHVKQTYNVNFSITGMTKWLNRQGFSYKKLKGVPAKCNVEEQAKFVAYYAHLSRRTPEDEPIEFGDASHPTMATKISYGWIRKGFDKPINTTASRTRLNLLGSINLEDMSLTISSYDKVNSESMVEHFKSLRLKYKKAPRIHLILDQGSYCRSDLTKEAAKEYGIVLHYLPSYSPNLNPIERVWKVMNERVRNNRYFATFKEFKKALEDFFKKTWDKIALSLVDRINDNFQMIQK